MGSCGVAVLRTGCAFASARGWHTASGAERQPGAISVAPVVRPGNLAFLSFGGNSRSQRRARHQRKASGMGSTTEAGVAVTGERIRVCLLSDTVGLDAGTERQVI